MGLARRYFSAPGLDRATELRDDPEELAGRLAAPSSTFLPIVGSRIALRRDADRLELGWVPAGAAATGQPGREASPAASATVFLGVEANGGSRFALPLSEADGERIAADHALEFRSLRSLAGLLDGEAAGLGAYALAMHLWLRNHRFCSACGAPARVDQGGFRLRCEGCERAHFPRLDPAIIVSVRDGARCLLGRQASWPPRRYSVLAGFVEPGESLEDAVAREVREESGVTVGETRYRGSQPWPFPSSLMLGFTARAASRKLVRGDELEDVRWFDPEDLLLDLRAGRVLLPPPLSISRFLIDEWLHETTRRDPESWAEEPTV